MKRRLRALPSPALVIACVSLAVALSGTAVAAGIVANAAHANRADLAKRALNADKIGGKTPAQIASAGVQAAQSAAQSAAQTPGPASSAAGLVTIKSAPWSLGPKGMADVTVTCDAGQKALSGGFDDPGGWAHPWDTRPTPDGASWHIFVTVSENAPGTQSGSIYAVCLK
jgi:hypothetical protein